MTGRASTPASSSATTCDYSPSAIRTTTSASQSRARRQIRLPSAPRSPASSSLLDELGFGLDLSACAVTGVTTDLAYVSPKTGRAVSREPAKPYCDRLLALPQFLISDAPPTRQDVADAFRLTGHFLRMHVWEARQVDPPSVREALIEDLNRV